MAAGSRLAAMKLYYGRMSGNSARAVFGLIESGAAHELSFVDTRKGENRSAVYLAVNPMGKIPAFEDGAFRLWESNAINWYVAETHAEAHLLPSTPQGRAAVQRWLYFQSGHVTPACVPLFRFTNARMQAFWGSKGDAAQAESAGTELARYLPVLESALQGRDWLERDFSLADIAYAPHLSLIAEGGYDFARYPAVRKWLDRLLDRPAWKKTASIVLG
jgi:glutathione S-transferase